MKINRKELKKLYKTYFKRGSKIILWFTTGAFFAIFVLVGIYYFSIKTMYRNKVYPGVFIGNENVGNKTQGEIKNIYDQRNQAKQNITFIFTYQNQVATVSASDIDFGFDSALISSQAISVGRSQDPISNLSLILQSNINNTVLPPSYSLSENKLKTILSPISSQIDKKPVNALFSLENNRVTTFRPSQEGQNVDLEELDSILRSQAALIMGSSGASNKVIVVQVPVKKIEPSLTTDKVNNLGIQELIGTGTSLFQHSIDTRIFNINLASSRVNGVLVAPGETFSFDKALGDVSAFTGYKQAYVIENGHTVLGDGGGVCQVSTTFFRALLDAGLPIVDRTAHAYRVGYYEEDSPPGIDATIYVPTVDLKFKNDTGSYILAQAVIDPSTLRLTFNLYGKKDGRQVSMTTPVITNQTAPPPPLYQDDPTLPAGTIKQTDFEAWGANVYFTRQVTKNSKVIISDKFVSNYRPWQAVYLRGTK